MLAIIYREFQSNFVNNCPYATVPEFIIDELPPPFLQQGPLYVPSPSSPVLVTVFYETLCPDSKHFVVRQLEPTFGRAGAFMDVRLVPYGKATVGCSIEVISHRLLTSNYPLVDDHEQGRVAEL